MKITTKTEALNIVETSYLASLSSLLWVALYYLPIGGALLRLILPLPMILLHLRRGTKIALEGVKSTLIMLPQWANNIVQPKIETKEMLNMRSRQYLKLQFLILFSFFVEYF